MCGRYATEMTRGDLQLEFDIDVAAADYRPPVNYNVAPTQDVPIIVARKPLPDDAPLSSNKALSDDAVARPASTASAESAIVRALTPAFWGLIAPWAKDLSRPVINARSETLTEKKMFAQAAQRRRCIIPASGYFEWRKPDKTPFYIYRPDSRPLAFAGLYGWYKHESEWLLTATIVTREATGEMADIHNRIPLILERHEYDTWLDPANPDIGVVVSEARTNPTLAYHQVHKAVGNVRNNTRANIEPASHGEQSLNLEGENRPHTSPTGHVI
ncbi:SOS response-associated peptidase [Trueperella bialowiezensis]|uniref:Abasic site processing protein n=1 Tax=Trueperella bialowiezensis TaxID=312285 RepID=A0A3S4Z651_9ACTO|nr:SOS response-associated peptidase [Trueperella bialowiezensis]VEI13826.1 Uncharacterised ACR, COG2135 [Trueperella bialowiezensis]